LTYFEIICSSSAVTIVFPIMVIASPVISTGQQPGPSRFRLSQNAGTPNAPTNPVIITLTKTTAQGNLPSSL